METIGPDDLLCGSFLQVSFLLWGLPRKHSQGSSWGAPSLETSVCVQVIQESHRPWQPTAVSLLAQAFKCEANRSNCYAFCPSVSASLVAQSDPDCQGWDVGGDGEKTDALNLWSIIQTVSRSLHEFLKVSLKFLSFDTQPPYHSSQIPQESFDIYLSVLRIHLHSNYLLTTSLK